MRSAIGFSSFGVLVYYSITNASAMTLERRRAVALLGLVGCMRLAVTLPWAAAVAGGGVLAVGVLAYAPTRRGS